MSRTHSAKGRVGRFVKMMIGAEDMEWREIARSVAVAFVLVTAAFGALHLTAFMTMALG